ncbi:rhs element Vgr domain protein [Burkholderia pseudomallei MSHR3709]|nr:rhs element Vgr domain protein [Burkholderia pseudomallei MSHR3709]
MKRLRRTPARRENRHASDRTAQSPAGPGCGGAELRGARELVAGAVVSTGSAEPRSGSGLRRAARLDAVGRHRPGRRRHPDVQHARVRRLRHGADERAIHVHAGAAKLAVVSRGEPQQPDLPEHERAADRRAGVPGPSAQRLPVRARRHVRAARVLRAVSGNGSELREAAAGGRRDLLLGGARAGSSCGGDLGHAAVRGSAAAERHAGVSAGRRGVARDPGARRGAAAAAHAADQVEQRRAAGFRLSRAVEQARQRRAAGVAAEPRGDSARVLRLCGGLPRARAGRASRAAAARGDSGGITHAGGRGERARAGHGPGVHVDRASGVGAQSSVLRDEQRADVHPGRTGQHVAGAQRRGEVPRACRRSAVSAAVDDAASRSAGHPERDGGGSGDVGSAYRQARADSRAFPLGPLQDDRGGCVVLDTRVAGMGGQGLGRDRDAAGRAGSARHVCRRRSRSAARDGHRLQRREPDAL